MKTTSLKVGALARQTGVSVRTLHYYEEVGLLSPSHRTHAGYRLYADRDVARLQQIKSLQQLGFSLQEIGGCLERPEFSPARVIELHLARLEEQMELQRRLRHRLRAIAERLRRARKVSVEEFIQAIKEVSMLEKYYTPEQMEQLKQRQSVVGEKRIRQVETEWKQLFEGFRAQMEKGADPAAEPVQALARKAKSLIQEFTGGDPGIARSLKKMYQQEGGPNVLARHGYQLDPGVWDYMSRAMAAAKD